MSASVSEGGEERDGKVECVCAGVTEREKEIGLMETEEWKVKVCVCVCEECSVSARRETPSAVNVLSS